MSLFIIVICMEVGLNLKRQTCLSERVSLIPKNTLKTIPLEQIRLYHALRQTPIDLLIGIRPRPLSSGPIPRSTNAITVSLLAWNSVAGDQGKHRKC
jgi:hypothetical protein